jgi:hypothetical protein
MQDDLFPCCSAALARAGLIQTSKKGVEHRNVMREADINARFPRLLKTILGYSE